MPQEGDTVYLQNDDVKIERCERCNALMVNLDETNLQPGDLRVLKRKNIRVSNPETEELICEHCDDPNSHMSKYYDHEDSDDDSSFFKSSSMFGGFNPVSSGGGFGGFGGGGFSGGGASRGF